MQVNHGAALRERGFRAMQGVVDGQEVTRGKAISPFDDDTPAALRRNGGPGKAAVECPHAGGGKIAMDLDACFDHRHAVEEKVLPEILGVRVRGDWMSSWRDGKRIDKRRQRGRIQGGGPLIGMPRKIEAEGSRCEGGIAEKDTPGAGR